VHFFEKSCLLARSTSSTSLHHLLHCCGSQYYYTSSPCGFVYDALQAFSADPMWFIMNPVKYCIPLWKQIPTMGIYAIYENVCI